MDKHGVLSNITSVFSKNKVSIKRIIQNPSKNKGTSSIVIITHITKDKSLNRILNIINKKIYILKRSKFIRISDN